MNFEYAYLPPRRVGGEGALQYDEEQNGLRSNYRHRQIIVAASAAASVMRSAMCRLVTMTTIRRCIRRSSRR